MSNTKRILNEIASSPEYTALAEAIEQVDYEAIFESYMRITRQINSGKGRIEEGIKSLPVRSTDERLDKFQQSFDFATERMLPLWHQLNLAIAKKQITEGEVFSIGKKGDPLVRTPEGRIVALRDSKLEEGSKVSFVVEYEGEKIDIGRVFDLNPQSFYAIITEEPRERIRSAFASIEEHLKSSQESLNNGSPSQLGELLVELEEIKKLPSNFRPEERETIFARVLKYRRGLIHDISIRLMFDFLSQQEEREIEDFYHERYEEKDKALSALGLFRRHTYEAAERFLPENKDEDHGQILTEIEDDIDSMESVMKLMDFKASIDKTIPKAKSYFTRMHRLFDRLIDRAEQVAEDLSETDIIDPDEIRLSIEKAFGKDTLSFELRKAFKNSGELLALRGAYSDLIGKLSDQESGAAEAAFRSYLNHKIPQAFGGRS